MNKYQRKKLKNLSENQINQIRVSFAKKIDPSGIARVYGLDTSTVLHIVAAGELLNTETAKLHPADIAQLKISYVEDEKTLVELSVTYGISVSTVHYHVKDLATERRERRLRRLIDPIRRGYLRGETIESLAKEFGQTKSMVYYHVKDLSVAPNKVRICGLTNKQIEDLRYQYSQNKVKVSVLATRFHVPKETVRNLLASPGQ